MDKRNLAILGCNTKYEMWLVVNILTYDIECREEYFVLDNSGCFPNNVVFDAGGSEPHYFNWSNHIDKDAYDSCEKITYSEFRERFKDEIKEIEEIEDGERLNKDLKNKENKSRCSMNDCNKNGQDYQAKYYQGQMEAYRYAIDKLESIKSV